MKKILFVILCCLCLAGCEKSSKTVCVDNATLDDGRTNNYTWTLNHNGTKIKEKSWSRIYEYQTLSEAIAEEKRAKEDCKSKDYCCIVSRNDKTITYYISYKCDNNSLEDNRCNYLMEIKSLEESGFTCTDTQ